MENRHGESYRLSFFLERKKKNEVCGFFEY